MTDYKKMAVDVLKASLPIVFGVLGGMLAYDGIKTLQMKQKGGNSELPSTARAMVSTQAIEDDMVTENADSELAL